MSIEFEGKIIADRYQVGPRLANGMTEDLYHGTHVLLDKPIIVKLLPARLITDDGAVHRFLEKVRIEGHLSHPNLLNMTDFGTSEDGSPYSVIEGVDVEPLSSLLDQKGALPHQEAVRIAIQAAQALDAAFRNGIVHGGLTPANILVPRSDGNVKVFDFGYSGGFNGRHPAYMAPELLTNNERSVQADVYALGAVLYEMLAGEPPFTGDQIPDVLKKTLEEPPPPLSAFRGDLPAAIEPVILRALAKDPAQRYQTPAEFAAALELAAGEVPAAGAAKASPKNIWKTAFIVLVGIALLSAFLIYATTSRQTNPPTALQPDANGQPVQPINPATGAEEQNLIVPGLTVEDMANTNMAQPPGTLPGGDGYNPWANGGVPPPGAPPSIPQGGQVITIDPNNPSQFMPPEGGVILVPVPVNTNTAAKPAPTPKTPAANVNTAAAATPKPAETKPTPTPDPKSTAPPQQKPKPAAKPTSKPEEEARP